MTKKPLPNQLDIFEILTDLEAETDPVTIEIVETAKTTLDKGPTPQGTAPLDNATGPGKVGSSRCARCEVMCDGR